MLIYCSVNNPNSILNTDNNPYLNSVDCNDKFEFNHMLDIAISIKNENNIELMQGILNFIREVHDKTTYGLKKNKDFIDILRMLGIFIDTHPIFITNDLYSIKCLTFSDIRYIIYNNPNLISNNINLRTYIRKKKLEEIMKNY